LKDFFKNRILMLWKHVRMLVTVVSTLKENCMQQLNRAFISGRCWYSSVWRFNCHLLTYVLALSMNLITFYSRSSMYCSLCIIFKQLEVPVFGKILSPEWLRVNLSAKLGGWQLHLNTRANTHRSMYCWLTWHLKYQKIHRTKYTERVTSYTYMEIEMFFPF
jgi:hypothetical protein